MLKSDDIEMIELGIQIIENENPKMNKALTNATIYVVVVVFII